MQLVPAQRVVFGNTVHGLFQVAHGKLSHAARDALERLGLYLDRQPQPFYSTDLWRHTLDIVVRDLFPDLPLEEAYRHMGHRLVLDVCESMLGRGMLALGRALGPRRLLLRLNHNFRNADNYVQANLTELAPTAYVVCINETLGMPSYYQGILEAALGGCGARAPHVQCLRVEGPSCTYRVEWDA